MLQQKRHKARLAGTTFNARKAKRDARTVAGREKLDALVRRLADLASLQEAALGPSRSAAVLTALDVSAAALVGAAALLAATAPPEPVAENPVVFEPPEVGNVVVGPRDVVRDVLDTSSCSDDGCSVGCLGNYKELRDVLADVVAEPVTPAGGVGTPPLKDGEIFSATESVVNFVLRCDEEPVAESSQFSGGIEWNAGCQSDWSCHGQRYAMQSAIQSTGSATSAFAFAFASASASSL